MKAELLREISKIENFSNPKIKLEQYMTPPELAADIIHSAYMQGDIQDKRIVDLGAGTGMLSVAAALAGAEVDAYEIDEEAIAQAEENAEKLGIKEAIKFYEKDISEIDESYDTAVMNPPFSVHSDGGEKFVRKALEVSDAVYSVIYGGSESGIREIVRGSDHELVTWEDYSISLPATYGFHTEDSQEVEVAVLITGKKVSH